MASIQGKPVSSREALSRGQQRLLLVEDNPADADLVKALLASRGDWTLHTATDGRQGIEMACAWLPNAILMDMKMPGISGLAAMAVLRGNPATAHIPVIVLSANAFPDKIAESLNAGALAYVTKPYRIEHLIAVIETALEPVTPVAGGHTATPAQHREAAGRIPA